MGSIDRWFPVTCLCVITAMPSLNVHFLHSPSSISHDELIALARTQNTVFSSYLVEVACMWLEFGIEEASKETSSHFHRMTTLKA